MKKLLTYLSIAVLFGLTLSFFAPDSDATFYRRGRLLKTGQTTQYSSKLDDGYYQKGLAKSYTVISPGTTTLIKLAHYVSAAGAITFNNTLHTIVDSGSGLAIFKTNDVIYTDSAGNLGPFTVTTGNSVTTITATGATFTDGTPAGTVTFYKAENHTNNVVFDNNTGLMWSQTVSGNMGAASDGKMPWTGQTYDIFAYAAAANAANLGGYNDWRIANRGEISSIINLETKLPDTTPFTGFPSAIIQTSASVDANNQFSVRFDTAATISSLLKTNDYLVLLIRGG